MKKIKLTQEQFALVDDDDFELLSQWKWCAVWNEDSQSFYAVRSEGKGQFRKTIYMHRQVMNTPKGLLCDHKNHNTLDNRKRNLRNVTHSQNLMNRRGATRKNKLGERCISRHRNQFSVEVKVGRKRVYRKEFRTIEEAIAARDAALREYHGEFSSPIVRGLTGGVE